MGTRNKQVSRLILGALALAVSLALAGPLEIRTDSSYTARPLRIVHDAQHNRTWVLEKDAVYLEEGGGKERIDLPGWMHADESYVCHPDLGVDAQGAAVITSNVAPILWRVDPRTHRVTQHALVLDSDNKKEVGFTGLAFAADQGVFFAVSGTYGTLWRIDPLLRRAQQIPISTPVRNACGLVVERSRTRRTIVLCMRGPSETRKVHLTPDQRSAYVRNEPCLEPTNADIAFIK